MLLELNPYQADELRKLLEGVSVREMIEADCTVVTIAEIWERLSLKIIEDKENGN